jgi:hypothetical protein
MWLVRISYYRSARGDEPVRDYIAGLPRRERDDWDEALTLLGLFGLEAPVSLRQLEGKLWEIRVGRQRVAYVIVAGSKWCCCTHSRSRGSKRRAATSIWPCDERRKFLEVPNEENQARQSAHRS